METDAATSRYRSRILREMSANRENPFNSPPSSTGSHGTVSPTMSSVFSDPDGESTRRLNEEIARVTGSRSTTRGKLAVNWEAAHRKWPEFYSMPKSGQPNNGTVTTDFNADAAKENIPPKISTKFTDDSTQDAWLGSKRTRAEMQPRVDDTEASSILSRSPLRPPVMSAANRAGYQSRNKSPLAKEPLPRPASPPRGDRRASLADMVNTARKPQAPSALANPQGAASNNISKLQTSKSSATKPAPRTLDNVRSALQPAGLASPGNNNTARSFVMPDISHLGDFVSGHLRFGGAENGVPVFVKHGKVRDRAEVQPPNDHAEVDGIEIPEDEEKIFVSMDMIRQEIGNLQEHDEIVQKYALDLQRELEHLQSQVRQLKHRRSIDSGLGSRSGSESEGLGNEPLVVQNSKLEAEVASLQRRLDQATQRITSNGAENETLSTERDQALRRLQEACENINELVVRLEQREQDLHSLQRQLGVSQQTQENNDTLRQDLATMKHEQEAMQLENRSLKADNNTLRREQQTLQEEIESLRSDNNSLRREHESLIQENRSLRSSNKNIMVNNDEQRHSVDTIQQELDAAREEIENLQNEVQVLEQEKATFKEDNDSLVRHNEKYFGENKVLRRENSGFERSIHDLHDENMRLKEEVEFLKQQLDHCRPIGKDEDLSARFDRDDEEEENMTSAFFVPDITIHSDDRSGQVEMTSQSTKPPVLPELTSYSDRLQEPEIADQTKESVTGPDDTFQSERLAGKGKQKMPPRDNASQGQKVAFSIPEPSTKSKMTANQGSKRRNTSQASARMSSKAGASQEQDPFQDTQDSIALQSQDGTQNQSVSMKSSLKVKSQKEAPKQRRSMTEKMPAPTEAITNHSFRAQSMHHSRTNTQNISVNLTSRSGRGAEQESCPVLSQDARRVLDGLCQHNCRNCIVCSRIATHRGAITAADTTQGKKRVVVPRPIPVTDRMVEAGEYVEEHTMRPAQSPGHALAMVIKGLEDEAAHLKMALSTKQAQYSDLNSSRDRRMHRELAAEIKALLKQLEVKNDQIYALYDVLEGQKQSGQAMTEEELEMTIFSITGFNARDMSEQVTWDGIQG